MPIVRRDFPVRAARLVAQPPAASHHALLIDGFLHLLRGHHVEADAPGLPLVRAVRIVGLSAPRCLRASPIDPTAGAAVPCRRTQASPTPGRLDPAVPVHSSFAAAQIAEHDAAREGRGGLIPSNPPKLLVLLVGEVQDNPLLPPLFRGQRFPTTTRTPLPLSPGHRISLLFLVT